MTTATPLQATSTHAQSTRAHLRASPCTSGKQKQGSIQIQSKCPGDRSAIGRFLVLACDVPDIACRTQPPARPDKRGHSRRAPRNGPGLFPSSSYWPIGNRWFEGSKLERWTPRSYSSWCSWLDSMGAVAAIKTLGFLTLELSDLLRKWPCEASISILSAPCDGTARKTLSTAQVGRACKEPLQPLGTSRDSLYTGTRPPCLEFRVQSGPDQTNLWGCNGNIGHITSILGSHASLVKIASSLSCW